MIIPPHDFIQTTLNFYSMFSNHFHDHPFEDSYWFFKTLKETMPSVIEAMEFFMLKNR